jgi:O-antigen/teichoic acid export membrane protein
VGMLCKIYLGLDMYLVGYLFGEGSAGIYQQAFKWAVIPMDIGTSFLATMALSWYASQVHLGTDKLVQAYRKITFHLLRFCIWVMAMLVLFLTDIFRWLYKPEWQEVPILFLFFLPYALGRPLMQNGYQVLQSMGKMKPVLWIAFIQAVASILFCFYGSKWGIHGLALAAGGSMIVGWLLSMVLISRSIQPGAHGKISIPLVLFLATLGLSWLSQMHLSEMNSFLSRVFIAGIYSAVAYREWSSRKTFADRAE